VLLARSALTLLATLLIAGCGSAPSQPRETAPTPAAADFPDADGRTLVELRDSFEQGDVVLSAAMSVLEPGETNRFGFGLFDLSRAQLNEETAAIYIARAGGGPALGPFPASAESLAVSPQFRSAGAEADGAQSVYAAEIPIGGGGQYEFLGAVGRDGEIVFADPASPPLSADPDNEVPDIGDQAPPISTPTYTSVGGDLEQIDTRVPAARELHEDNFADVVGKRPAVLMFATPALCQTRVCGPVVDEMLEVSAEAPEEIAFIHQEVYIDNELEKGVRPQLTKFGLQSEPWTFVVGADGRIVERFEGAFSIAELREAVSRL